MHGGSWRGAAPPNHPAKGQGAFGMPIPGVGHGRQHRYGTTQSVTVSNGPWPLAGRLRKGHGPFALKQPARRPARRSPPRASPWSADAPHRRSAAAAHRGSARPSRRPAAAGSARRPAPTPTSVGTAMRARCGRESMRCMIASCWRRKASLPTRSAISITSAASGPSRREGWISEGSSRGVTPRNCPDRDSEIRPRRRRFCSSVSARAPVSSSASRVTRPGAWRMISSAT